MSSAETEYPPGNASLIATPLTVPASDPARAHLESRSELAVIDQSVRVPTLLFFGSGLAWLLIGSALAPLAWYKMLCPEFLSKISWLTFGRLWPAQQDVFVYGWAGSVALGAGLWIMARLCRVPLRHGGVLLVAWLLWNIGILLGVLGILNGDGTSVVWLEFPRYTAPLLFTAYAFIAIWAVLMFRFRRAGHDYVSQWYLLVSFLWFPWIYATASLIQFFLPVQPAAQEITHWWYVGNLFGPWLGSAALAAAYFLVPKTVHRPVHHYGSAVFAFWAFIALSSWSGLTHLIGGPAPAWLVTVSIVANIALLLPILTIVGNLRGTLGDDAEALRRTPSLRFAIVGIYCLLAAGILSAFTSFRTVSAVTQFSQVIAAQEHLYFAGFISLILFGAVYYIMPRLIGQEWASSDLIRWHFWFNAVGLALTFLCLLLGGFLQGFGLNDAKIAPISILNLLEPFLIGAGVGVLLMVIGNICFAASCVLLVFNAGRRLAVRPVVIVPSSAAVNPVAAPVTVP
jgi:cytochrome c oxidase cbb3-type subunit 1